MDIVDFDELKDTAGVKVIRFDEDIRKVFCARSTSPFGYIAVLGTNKLSIYLAYADEATAMYDHIVTMSQWDFRNRNVGPKVELIDFTDSCESFVSYQSTGEICLWSISKKEFREKLWSLGRSDMPLTKIRAVQEDRMIVGYSRNRRQFIVL